MDDLLLAYYNRELNYIRKMGAEFAEQHPKIAGRLRIDNETIEDPHVSRLVESFAFLTARIRHTLDDNFPELTESLVGILYPDFHAPLPSMAIAQLSCGETSPKSIYVEKNKGLRTATSSGDVCYYRSTSDVGVIPVDIDTAKFSALPVKSPRLPSSFSAHGVVQSILRLHLTPKTTGEDFDVKTDSLRFYVNASGNVAFKLHEYLLTKTVGVAIASDPMDDDPLFLKPENLSPCGFAEEESIIDYDGRASSAHRLITEFFQMPQKFLFVNLDGVEGIWEKYPEGFNIYFYFSESDIELLRAIDESSLLLGCTPIVNLFDAEIETIQPADVTDNMMLHVANSNVKVADIYHIDEIYGVNEAGKKQEIKPFYGSYIKDDGKTAYWAINRENSSWQRGYVSHGTDTHLTFVDSEYKFISPGSKWLIGGNVVANNRDLPSKLPFGPDQPKMELVQEESGIDVRCLTPPTPTVQPQLEKETRGQLVTQLSLQHLCHPEGLTTLKESLHLYNVSQSKEVTPLIDGVIELKTEVATARILDRGRSSMCQGTHFTLTCDESFYTGSSIYLFGLILDQFLAQFCSINTFTQLSIKSTKNYRVQYQWPPRIGSQPLV